MLLGLRGGGGGGGVKIAKIMMCLFGFVAMATESFYRLNEENGQNAFSPYSVTIFDNYDHLMIVYPADVFNDQ